MRGARGGVKYSGKDRDGLKTKSKRGVLQRLQMPGRKTSSNSGICGWTRSHEVMEPREGGGGMEGRSGGLAKVHRDAQEGTYVGVSYILYTY